MGGFAGGHDLAYFTKNSLQSYAGIHRLDQSVTRNLRKAATDAARIRVFLSHSHLDIAAADSDDVKAAPRSSGQPRR